MPVTTAPSDGRAEAEEAEPEVVLPEPAVPPLRVEFRALVLPLFEPSELDGEEMTGAAVGQSFVLGCVVQLAQPIVVVPEKVSGKSWTFVPPQSRSVRQEEQMSPSDLTAIVKWAGGASA